eukprot:m.6258 g.6258  ORF g.6258 m.6258 type:complete len:299 (+) comp15385_c0_seq1:56-952(+)
MNAQRVTDERASLLRRRAQSAPTNAVVSCKEEDEQDGGPTKSSHLSILYFLLAIGAFIFPLFVVQYVTKDSCKTVPPMITQAFVFLLELLLAALFLVFVFLTWRKEDDRPESTEEEGSVVPFSVEESRRHSLSASDRVSIAFWLVFGLVAIGNFVSDMVAQIMCWSDVRKLNSSPHHLVESHIVISSLYDGATLIVIVLGMMVISLIYGANLKKFRGRKKLYPFLLAFTILVYLLIWCNTFSSEAAEDTNPFGWDQKCAQVIFPPDTCNRTVAGVATVKKLLYPMTADTCSHYDGNVL